MATIQNEIDKILQAAGTRILPVSLPTYITIPWVGVTSKPPILGTDATISATNYATYMDAQSVSAMAFSENTTGISAPGTISTTLNFDSNGENVLVILSGVFKSNGFATGGECACDVGFDIISGATYLTDILCRAPNMAGAGIAIT
jgi:hypothetical protein